MKQISISRSSLLALILALVLVLGGCTSHVEPSGSSTDSTPVSSPEEIPSSPDSLPVSSPDSTPTESVGSTPIESVVSTPEQTAESTPVESEPVSPEDLISVETFIAPEVMETITEMFESNNSLFSCYVTNTAPFAIRNTMAISDCKLLSITIPVYKTLTADENGDFIFTIYVVNNTNTGLRKRASREYPIKINGAEYGIEANDGSVFKMITVDLSSYGIVLADDETVAFFGKTDTLYPGYLLQDKDNLNEASKFWKQNAPQCLGFFMSVGGGFAYSQSHNSLVFDFTVERTYDTLAEKKEADNASASFAEKVAALKEKYGGKKLSILGDSISTFRKISNNINYNKTIGSNAVYYPDNNPNFVNHNALYWGHLITDLDMSLCVDNAWSGSYVYGQSGASYKDSMPRRATELSHRRNGDPDLILVYMGINDVHHTDTVPFGNLYGKLSAVPEDERAAIVEEWFAAVKATSDANPGYVPGKSYSEWAEAYALGLYAMKQKYPNAEIYCMTLIQNNDNRCTDEKINGFNTCIRAIAEYLEIGLIDQERDGYITPENCHAYSGDTTALHPSPIGHILMERLIVETLYENLDK